jgi:hypothetical protein
MKYYSLVLLIVLFSCKDNQIMETTLVNKEGRLVGMLADENANYIFSIEEGLCCMNPT